MSVDATQTTMPTAWQPFTFGGLAAYARSSFGRVLALAAIVAVLLAGATLWFLNSAWVPPIEQAISKLPEHAGIRNRALAWTNEPLTILSDSRMLTIIVDVEGNAWEGRVADVQVQLRATDVRVCSIFGCARFPYPAGYVITLDQSEIKPAWGAWKPTLLAGATVGFTLQIFLQWLVLATIGGLLLRLFAFALGRDVTLGGAWRVALAALMPGALSLVVAMCAYAIYQISLPGLFVAFLTHLLVDVVYLTGALFALPRIVSSGATRQANPFASAPDNPS